MVNRWVKWCIELHDLLNRLGALSRELQAGCGLRRSLHQSTHHFTDSPIHQFTVVQVPARLNVAARTAPTCVQKKVRASTDTPSAGTASRRGAAYRADVAEGSLPSRV